MYNLYRFLLCLGVLCGTLVRAQVPNTFAPNTPIKSTDVNANFTALDNGKQARVTGTCGAGSAVASVAANGTVTCNVGPVGPKGDQGIQGIQGIQGPPGTGPLAFGFVNGAGTKISGSSNWSVTWNAASKWYEITITGQ